jgi:TonB family protein
MRSVHSLNKFIVASAIIHLGFLGGAAFFAIKKERALPVEISFGTGNSRGGSGPKAVVASAPQAAPKKIAAAPKVIAVKAPPIVTDAPVINKPTVAQDSVSSSSSSVAPTDAVSGSGLGTTSGTGSGYTSGAGAGFNDPKIRYRGMVKQLVDSHKKYPRKAQALQQEGTVIAKIRLSKAGKLLKVEIVESSSYKILADATLDAIKGIKKFPEIPSELGLDEITFNIPFEYGITNGDFI